MIGWLIAKAIALRLDRRAAQDLRATFELRVRLLGRVQRLTVAVADGSCEVLHAASARAEARATVSLADMIRMALGIAGWPELVSSGRLALDGDPFLALRLPGLFRLPAARRGLGTVS
jgi:SCP-2 sterol transfer family